MSKWAYLPMDNPYAVIQWKGTNVCMDCQCLCGESFHVDAEFAYGVQCPYCSRRYEMSGHVKMREMDIAEIWDGCEIVIGE